MEEKAEKFTTGGGARRVPRTELAVEGEPAALDWPTSRAKPRAKPGSGGPPRRAFEAFASAQ
jgi:hypothetical protein